MKEFEPYLYKTYSLRASKRKKQSSNSPPVTVENKLHSQRATNAVNMSTYTFRRIWSICRKVGLPSTLDFAIGATGEIHPSCSFIYIHIYICLMNDTSSNWQRKKFPGPRLENFWDSRSEPFVWDVRKRIKKGLSSYGHLESIRNLLTTCPWSQARHPIVIDTWNHESLGIRECKML